MNKKNILLVLMVAVISVLLLAEYLGNKPQQQKGTWIWDTPAITTQSEEILAFASQNDVTHLYLYIDRKNVTPHDYAQFIKEASKQDIKVEALGGDPSWGWKEKRPNIQELIEWVESYNRNVNMDERFTGIHLDIEPYLLPEWKDDQDRVIEEWLSNLEFAAKEVRSIKRLQITVDLPFWVNKIDVPGYLDYSVSTWMLKRFDTVVLMDYRDFAEGEDGIVSNALDMVKEASSMGKSVIVGVEMAKSGEGDKATFFEEGYQEMENELEEAHRHFRKQPGFRGFAVHGFPDWKSSYQTNKKGEKP
ncbi:hypothetical protein [Ammoniphilus sp. 3BR4]|uniref:hypothetical protein n=1 Tax=Ammoniphilus sp. 3BR4 TaxID=3158265 RepID=UPI00346766E3